MKLRVGSRFGPTELGLVRRYLRNMVERNESGYIKTMDVYKDEPWRLDHVSNILFKKNEWYYFVPRTKRGTKSASRMVPRRGESEGGTWKTTGKIEAIKDGNKKVVGYKQSLVYNKNVNGKQEKTNWLMTEFSRHKDGNEFQYLVLCWIRYKKDKKLNLGFNDAPLLEIEHQQHEQEDAPVLALPPLPPQNNNNNDMMMNSMLPLPPQYNNNDMIMNSMLPLPPLPPQNNNNNMMMNSMLPLPPPYPQGQYSGFQTMMMTTNESNCNNFSMQSYDNNFLMHGNNFLIQNNDNNFLMPMSNYEQYRFDDFGFDGAENMMFDIDELMESITDGYTQQQEDQLQLTPPIPQVTGHET